MSAPSLKNVNKVAPFVWDDTNKTFVAQEGIATEAKQDEIINAQNSNFATRIAVKSDDTNITYIGTATVGSTPGTSVWKIKRITSDGDDVVIEFADGNTNFDNEWDNRETLTYS